MSHVFAEKRTIICIVRIKALTLPSGYDNNSVMAFSNGVFGHHEHRIYRSTFLRKVEGAIVLDGAGWMNKEGIVRMRQFGEKRFGPTLSEGFKSGAVSFKSIDGKFNYTFDKTRAMVEISQKGYVSFDDTLRGAFVKMRDFGTEVVGSGTVRRVEIKKSNLMMVMTGKNEGKLDELLRCMLRGEYGDLLMEGNSREAGIVKNVKGISDDIGDGGRIVREIGWDKEAKGRIDITLDITAVYEPEGGMETRQVVEKSEELNQLMFDAFLDTVSDACKSMMEA